MDLPPPTSAAAGWRPTLMPTVAMIISMYVRVQQYHAFTRTPRTHLGSQQHTHRSILDTSTSNPLAIVPARPSSRLPRHEPRSAPPFLSLRPPSHLFLSLASRIPFASPRRTSTLCRPRHAAHRPNDQQTFSPHRHLPSFLPRHLAPHPHSHPTHTTLRTPIPHDGTAGPPTPSITRFDPALTRRDAT